MPILFDISAFRFSDNRARNRPRKSGDTKAGKPGTERKIRNQNTVSRGRNRHVEVQNKKAFKGRVF